MIRLLIVEDDTNLSFLIKKKLERQGDYLVETAVDGKEGLNLLMVDDNIPAGAKLY